MLTNSDFRELLSLFEKYRIRYLVVGAYAVMKYSEPRFTKGLDLWIATDMENAHSVYVALKEFGAPRQGAESRVTRPAKRAGREASGHLPNHACSDRPRGDRTPSDRLRRDGSTPPTRD